MLRALLSLALLALAGQAASRPAEDELAEARVALRSADKWVRKSAVEKLAATGTAAAWELVIAALEDDRGEVADTAQLLLAGLGDEKLCARLLGREGLEARDPWVRQRAAELLARGTLPVDGERIAAALADRDADVRRTLLWTLERLAGSPRLRGDLAKRVVPAVARHAEGDADPLVQGRALFALAALAPAAAVEAVRAGLADRAPPVRCAAAALAPAVLGGAAALPLLRERAADPSLLVRTRVVDVLASLRTREAVQALVERLAAEKEVRLGWRIVERLQALTGHKYRRDPRSWQLFADRLPADWTPPPPAAEAPSLGEDRSRAFAGLPLLSGRVAFLIDLSGSIWMERADGKTKKEVLDAELRAALEKLPADTLFNVIPFTEKPLPWKEALAPATPANVRRAVDYFAECRAQGTGNVWDAFLLAIADPAVDTIVVLTDGVPTGGRRHRLELIVPLLEERNATRMVVVDSILAGAPRRIQAQWADLSARTGGRSVSFDL
ncbi:MAG: hypothetical protein AB1726_13970 [Planctomycetota bacterium]